MFSLRFFELSGIFMIAHSPLDSINKLRPLSVGHFLPEDAAYRKGEGFNLCKIFPSDVH